MARIEQACKRIGNIAGVHIVAHLPPGAERYFLILQETFDDSRYEAPFVLAKSEHEEEPRPRQRQSRLLGERERVPKQCQFRAAIRHHWSAGIVFAPGLRIGAIPII